MDLFGLSLLLSLSLIGFCADQKFLPDGPLDILVGENMTLQILVERQPDDIITWAYSDGTKLTNIATLRSGVVVSDSYKGRAFVNSTNGYLTLTSMKVADTGDYSLQILLGTGPTVAGEIKVRVLEPVSDVVITSNIPEAIEYNDTVVLTCFAKGSFLKFSWTNGTTPVVADSRLTVTDMGGSSQLKIPGVLRSDLVGPIFCNAMNSKGNKMSLPFNLTVFYGPDQASLAFTKPGEFIASKSDFNLTCEAPSKPPATFTWYHNQIEIKGSGPVLTLKAIEEQGFGKEPGVYMCRAQNAKTKRVVASPGVRLSVIEPISGAKITGPSGILIAGNSSANLSCQATSGNVTERTWLKDGKVLSASSNVVISSDKSSVLINMLQKEDNGIYTCKLKNLVSQDEVVFKLAVSFGPEPAKVEGKYEVELDDKVILICSAQSVPPANFTWKLNGTVIETKTSQLIIDKAIYKDSGTYTCEAFNAITGKTTTTTHSLSVKEEIYEGLSDGAIAGIVIACLIVVGAALAAFFYCRQKVPAETRSPY